jgi:hypothetical protein
MFEKSTSDARPVSDEPVHRCVAGNTCKDTEFADQIRYGAITARQDTLCEACTGTVRWVMDDIQEIWVALHMAIGDHSRRPGQRVSSSPTAPINVNTDVDALKAAIVEWLVAAAARVAEQLNIDDPQPRNNTDTENARVVAACTRILTPNLDKLLASGPDDVTLWLTQGETDYPGESIPAETPTGYMPNVKQVMLTGIHIALKLRDLHRDARSLLALTTPVDRLSLPCPGCNQYQLIRSHTLWGQSEIDRIDCAACKLEWPYERYRQLCLIWVKEDEMERERLQEQLEGEVKRRELAEWLLAKREWQFALALQCTDVSAAEFAQTVVNTEDIEPSEDEYMSDKDIAILVGVSPGTVRSWASRQAISRHTAEDGSTLFNAREVWEYARTAPGGRNAASRRAANMKV